MVYTKQKLAETVVVLCREAKMHVGSGSGNFRQNRVGPGKMGNVKKNLLNFSLRVLFNADKSED